MTKTEEDKIKGKGTRSPNYPVVSLKKSVEQVGQLYDTHKMHIVPVQMLHELWGYIANSSVGDQCVAAAKAFGLIETEGKGKSKKAHISERGHRIYMKAPDYEDLLKKACLSPSVYTEIWEHYNGDLPNDELLKNYLVWEHQPRFNEKSVDRFIALFKESISFASLASCGIIGGKIEDDGLEKDAGDDKMLKPPSTSKTGIFDLPIPLLDGLSGLLRVPRPMSEDNYNQLRSFLETILKTIKPTLIAKQEQDVKKENVDE